MLDVLDEQIIAAALKSNPKKIKLKAGADGNILVDKEKHPEVYDWAVKDSENDANLRQIGILDGKAAFNINGNGKISEEDFF